MCQVGVLLGQSKKLVCFQVCLPACDACGFRVPFQVCLPACDACGFRVPFQICLLVWDACGFRVLVRVFRRFSWGGSLTVSWKEWPMKPPAVQEGKNPFLVTCLVGVASAEETGEPGGSGDYGFLVRHVGPGGWFSAGILALRIPVWFQVLIPYSRRALGGGRLFGIDSNARCLTEGIDVPALDAILFLHPRKSDIDVVQAVGRVMRRGRGQGVRLHHPAHRPSPQGYGPGIRKQQRVQGRLAGHQRHQCSRFTALKPRSTNWP